MNVEVGVGTVEGGSAMHGGLLSVYRAMLAAGEIKPDPAQEEIAAALHALGERLAVYRPAPVAEGFGGWLERLRFGRQGSAIPPRGLYVWGDVGRGKSMLMDLFFAALDTHAKRRVHFHAFMREVHEQLFALRREPHTFAAADMVDPLSEVARLIAHDTWVLCLDELEINDIGDAMIVGRLFDALTARGVVVVTTSNRPPRDLYKDGLQREKFLPFIDLILSRMEVLHLAAERDYRLGRLKGAQLYLTPLTAETAAELDRLFLHLAGSVTPHPDVIPVKGREVPVPRAACCVAWFGFDDLCARPLGPTDYMEIAARYQAVVVAGIPRMTGEMASEARRFVTMVDVFYDHRVKLICSAAAPPAALYDGAKGGFEFHRTVSRLMEMQADDYLGDPHQP
ncbi:cell division protein ZapE [Oleispirillum naphthae]|uniref:cell division protein ZapE n=1 Tax=Oleispirillum naphthae TaxID=2838853 RepID=UPI0030822462